MNERLKKLLEQRAAKLAELRAAGEEGSAEVFETLEAELSALDSQITETRSMIERIATATVAGAVEEERAAQPVRLPVHVTDLGTQEITGGEERDSYESLAHQCIEIRYAAKNPGQFIRDGVMAYRHRETGQTEFPLSLGRQIRAATGAGVDVGADGGALVQEDHLQDLSPTILDATDLPGMCTRRDIAGNRLIMVHLKNYDKSSSFTGAVTSYWLGEGGTFTASQPIFEKKSHELRKVGALVYATEELLEDAVQFNSFLQENVPMELRMALADKIVNGSGTGEPAGILTADATISIAKETDQDAQTFQSENVINMDARFLEFNMASVAWLFNRGLKTQFPLLNLAVGVGGALVYTNPTMGLAGPQPSSLLGKPMLPCQYCAARGTTGDIILADMSQYVLGLKNGGTVKAMSSIHVQFLTQQTAFLFSLRADGRLKHSSAITPKNVVSGETLSPFVKLDTRS